MLEGEHPVEGSRPARSYREYDSSIREGQGALMHRHSDLPP